DLAAVVDARAGTPVDPAVEAHRHRREAVTGSVLDVDGKRGRVAAGAHRTETGLVDGLEQARLHVGDDWLGITLAVWPHRRELGDLGAVIECAADADADDHRRTMLRAGL